MSTTIGQLIKDSENQAAKLETESLVLCQFRKENVDLKHKNDKLSNQLKRALRDVSLLRIDSSKLQATATTQELLGESEQLELEMQMQRDVAHLHEELGSLYQELTHRKRADVALAPMTGSPNEEENQDSFRLKDGNSSPVGQWTRSPALSAMKSNLSLLVDQRG